MGAVAQDRVQIDLVLDAHASTGECPTWSAREQALYWIDVDEPSLHRLDPADATDRRWPLPSQVGAIAPCEDGSVLVALRTGLARLDPATGECRPLALPPYDSRTHRFNDGRCDAQGRFWVGTMHAPQDDALPANSPRAGTRDDHQDDSARPAAEPLHVLGSGGALHAAAARATIANGLCWSPDHRVMYVTDTDSRTIRAFDFDAGRGTLGRSRVLARFEPSQGKPDGATVDAEGGYWCALYGGGCVVQLDAQGAIVRRIALPVSQPTMCAFGGERLDTLFVTSAAKGLDDEAKRREPHAGGVFACRPGVRGLPVDVFREREPS